MLKRVEFKNIKSLESVELDLCTGSEGTAAITVLVGPNGSGKSTVLDQIQSLCVFSQPDGARNNSLGSAGEWLRNASRTPTRQRTTSSKGPMYWRGLAIDGTELRLTIPEGDDRTWYTRAQTNVVAGGEAAELRQESGAAKAQAFDDLLKRRLAWRCQRLSLQPGRIAATVDARVRVLRASGYGLAAVLQQLASNDHDAWMAVQDDLRSIVPEFERLSIAVVDVQTNGATTGGNELSLWMRGAGKIPASAVSDGTLLALGLLTATHNRSMPSLILMDDVDHGLHLDGQLALIRAMQEVMKIRPEMQVVCTTHSPYLLRDILPTQVRVLALDAAGRTRVRSLAEHPEISQWDSAFSAGELWANLGEEWVVASA